MADIEKIRRHLNINKWVVFGGSWGSTLALSYSILNSEYCKGLILRGIFMIRKKEINWFYQEGASNIFPDAWENYIMPIPENKRNNLVAAYYEKLTSNDEKIRLDAAKAWSIWEARTSKLFQSKNSLHHFDDPKVAEAFARIECHYFINSGFFEYENWILDNVNKIKHLPIVIIQGRYDIVCPMISAWELHKLLPNANFEIIQDAGHSMTEPSIALKLIDYTNKFVKY